MKSEIHEEKQTGYEVIPEVYMRDGEGLSWAVGVEVNRSKQIQDVFWKNTVKMIADILPKNKRNSCNVSSLNMYAVGFYNMTFIKLQNFHFIFLSDILWTISRCWSLLSVSYELPKQIIFLFFRQILEYLEQFSHVKPTLYSMINPLGHDILQHSVQIIGGYTFKHI